MLAREDGFMAWIILQPAEDPLSSTCSGKIALPREARTARHRRTPAGPRSGGGSSKLPGAPQRAAGRKSLGLRRRCSRPRRACLSRNLLLPLLDVSRPVQADAGGEAQPLSTSIGFASDRGRGRPPSLRVNATSLARTSPFPDHALNASQRCWVFEPRAAARSWHRYRPPA